MKYLRYLRANNLNPGAVCNVVTISVSLSITCVEYRNDLT